MINVVQWIQSLFVVRSNKNHIFPSGFSVSIQLSECCSSPLYHFLDLCLEHLQISDKPMSEERAFFLGKLETGSLRHSPSVMWVLKISEIMIILQQGRNNGPSGGREGRSQSIFCDRVLMTIIRQSVSLHWMPDLLPTWWPPYRCSVSRLPFKTNWK